VRGRRTRACIGALPPPAPAGTRDRTAREARRRAHAARPPVLARRGTPPDTRPTPIEIPIARSGIDAMLRALHFSLQYPEYSASSHRRRIMPTRVVCVGLLISLSNEMSSQTSPAGPREVVMRGVPNCGACGVSVQRAMTLAHDDWSLAGFVSIAGRAGGQLYVAPLGSTIYVFSESGKFLRTIGRSGQGPGEFVAIRTIESTAGDSLLVFDELRRFSLFSPSFSHIRTHVIPYAATSAINYRDGSLVIAAMGRLRSDAGFPLHVRRPDGTAILSFGVRDPIVDPARPAMGRRYVALALDEDLWSAMADTYHLEKWDRSGKLLATLIREAPWFPPPGPNVPKQKGQDGETRPHKLTEAPQAAVTGIQVAEDGHLWVLAAVASVDWRSRNLVVGEGVSYTPAKLDDMYDSVLEEIDPLSGKILSSVRISQYIADFVGRGTLASLRDLPSGERVIDVWKFTKTTIDKR